MTTSAGKRSIKQIGSGKPPVNPPSVTQTQVTAPAGGVGAAAGGWDTAENRDLAIASINAARTDIAAIMKILRDYGFAV